MTSRNLPHFSDCDRPLHVRRRFDRSMQWDGDSPGDLIERIWEDPHALLADGSMLQDKPRCTVVRIDHLRESFVWKHHNWGTLRRTFKRSLSRSSARKSWLDAGFLYLAGVPTPRPRAIVERRLGPFKTCSYILTDYVPGTSLYRLMRFERPTRDVVHELARQVATIWQQLEELRVCHRDLKPENLLVDPQGKVWLIDMERMRRYRRLAPTRRHQAKDLRDLLHPRNWRSDPAAAEVFRRELSKTPAGESLAAALGAAQPLARPLPPANNPSQLVSVLVPCCNAAETITACLESVRDMADEILVADQGSTDGTLRLAHEFGGCRIVENHCPDPIAFETWANAQARHPWILRVLPDEQINSELGRQVQDILATEPAEDGFLVARTTVFHGHRLKFGGWEREASVRLYRKNVARFELRGGRVDVAVTSGKTGRLSPRLVYQSLAGIEQRIGELAQVAARAADGARRQGLSPKRRAVLCHAPWQFLRSYFLHWGWLDGWAGLHASCLAAIEIYLREALLWESHQRVVRQRALARDGRQSLKFFDPDNASEAGGAAAAAPAVPDSDQQQMRPAA